MRIVIDGSVCGNGGDAAIVEAQLDNIRRVANDVVHVTIADRNPSIARQRFPDVDVVPRPIDAATRLAQRRFARRLARTLGPPLWLYGGRLNGLLGSALSSALPAAARPCLDAYRQADLVYYTGGTSLVENYRLADKLFNLQFALALQRPVVLGTQSLGPFRDPQNAKRMKEVANSCEAVLLRDDLSRQHLLEIGVRDNHLHVLPDIVFYLADRDRLRTDPDEQSQRSPRVAISARNWAYFKHRSRSTGMREYVDSLRELTTWLVQERDADVVYLSTCQGIAEYAHDDSELAVQIVAGLDRRVQQAVTVDRAARSAEELIAAYAEFDVVVATRMHAAVLSLCAGTPVLPIAYEFKTAELFRSLGMQRWTLDIDTIDPATLIETCAGVLTNVVSIATQLRTEVPRLAEQAGKAGSLALMAAR